MSELLAGKVVHWLFQTGAIRVSPADKPFWYTSGLIGPYYVNTHFLYGGEKRAGQLLELIDRTREEPLVCVRALRDALWENYRNEPVFRQVTDTIVQYIRQHYTMECFDAFSGGERRDWFFSLLPAEILDKPHLMIFKNQQVVSSTNYALDPPISGQRLLHISDLITEASSYLRAWIPALLCRGAAMTHTLTIVDRCQGGRDALGQARVAMRSLVQIDLSLFKEAKLQGHLTDAQYELVERYLADPFGSMRGFLAKNPAFLQNALENGGREQERASLMMEQDLYRLRGLLW